MSATDETVQHRCEWPRKRGSIVLCGNRAAYYMVTRPGVDGWGRWCCGVHANRARHLGWSQQETP